MIHPSQPFSSRELLLFYYKYRRRLWLAFLIPFTLFILLSFIPTPRYKAESTLIVRMGSEYVYQPETGNTPNGPAPAIPFDREQVARSEVAILDSDALHRQTIETVGLENLYPHLVHPEGMGKITAALSDWLEPLDPAALHEKQLARATITFDKRFDILLEKDSAVIQLTFEHADSALAAKTLDVLLKLYFDTRRQIYLDPHSELAAAQMQNVRAHVVQAEQAMADFKQQHKIYALADERAELLRQRSEVEREMLIISSSGLQGQLASYNKRLDQLDALERELNGLQKDAQIASDAYSLYSHQLDEARAEENLQQGRIGSVRVIQPPLSPAEPKHLQLYIILFGFFISVFSVLFMAGWTEYFKSGFLTPAQLERALHLPVLAVLPHKA